MENLPLALAIFAVVAFILAVTLAITIAEKYLAQNEKLVIAQQKQAVALQQLAHESRMKENRVC